MRKIRGAALGAAALAVALACPCAWALDEAGCEGLPLGFSDAAALPLLGAGAETLGNGLAIARGAAIESNGMVSASPAGLLGLLALKAAMVKYADAGPPERRDFALKTNAGLFNGFGASNLLIAAGAATGVAAVAGLVAGWWAYASEEQALARESNAKMLSSKAGLNAGPAPQNIKEPKPAAAMSVQEMMARAERKAIEDMKRAGTGAKTMLFFETSWEFEKMPVSVGE